MTVFIQGIDKVSVQVQGVNVKQSLNPANETVNKGLYNATTLSTVETDLAAANIKSGIMIFGFVGLPIIQDISAANATIAQVLAANTFFAVSGTIKTGTMGDYSAAGITIVPSTIKQNLPGAGYWLTTDASMRVLGSAYLIGANIKSGVTIFGVTGTYDTSASPIAAARMRTNDEGWVNGSKITGSGTVTLADANSNYPTGYHAGAASLAAVDGDLTPANIKTGVNIFGYVGTYDTTLSAPTAAQVILNKVCWANGAQITGTMPTVAIASGNNAYPAGYHVGAAGLSTIEATLATANIKSGINIFGFVGPATVQDISAADAAVTDVLTPKTFFSATGAIKTGTIIPANLLLNGSFEVGDPPTGWTLGGGGASVVRSTEQVKVGTYSAKLTRVTNEAYILQNNAGFIYYRGRQVTLGCWVYATVALRANIQIHDGVSYTYSSYHSGVAGWEWITVTRTLNGAATALYGILNVFNGDTSAYFDGAILVEGDSCPAFYDSPYATKVLDPANDTVAEGYYFATTLHAVDPDLAAANIKSGVNIFGFDGSGS